MIEPTWVSDCGELHFQLGRTREAIAFVKRVHYSNRCTLHSWLTATVHKDGGLFGDLGEIVAALVMIPPPARWREPVVELNRLARSGAEFPLTRLIAFACDHAKRKGADLLVSYADPIHGHHGGVYQAASWAYHGVRPMTKPDGYYIDGRYFPSRTLNDVYSTSGTKKLKEIFPGEGRLVPHYGEQKHLYWRALNRAGKKKAQRLGLQCNQYPKPSQVMAGEP